MPVSTSPLPAVAMPGFPAKEIDATSPPCAISVPAALQRHHRAVFGQRGRGVRTMRLDPCGILAKESPRLAGMRREDRACWQASAACRRWR